MIEEWVSRVVMVVNCFGVIWLCNRYLLQVVLQG